jgi:choline dehydrogenase
MTAYVEQELAPGPSVQSDEEYLAYAKAKGDSSYHLAGTCRMGPATQRTSVLDARLRVHGVAGLRVADASIMPVIVSGNTNATSIMIGEKAAAMIAEDART